MDACHLHPTRAIMKNEAIKKKMKKKKTKKTSRISEKDVVVVHERDVREGREAGSNGSHSCNVFEKRPKKNQRKK
jgi:hypothetical protein